MPAGPAARCGPHGLTLRSIGCRLLLSCGYKFINSNERKGTRTTSSNHLRLRSPGALSGYRIRSIEVSKPLHRLHAGTTNTLPPGYRLRRTPGRRCTWPRRTPGKRCTWLRRTPDKRGTCSTCEHGREHCTARMPRGGKDAAEAHVRMDAARLHLLSSVGLFCSAAEGIAHSRTVY